jgi:ubiquitin C-terminal hydrolase
MNDGAIGGLTVQGLATSLCATCGRLVTGNAGDIKVVVEHVEAVFCSDCFDHHPNREDWTCPKTQRGRPAHKLRKR